MPARAALLRRLDSRGALHAFHSRLFWGNVEKGFYVAGVDDCRT